jgi:hypothetical protein
VAGPALEVHLDSPLPARVAVGRGTAIFVHGWCFAPAARIASLSFVVDGAVQPVTAHGMPRLDAFRALHPHVDPFATRDLKSDPDSPDDPRLNAYASGFWGMVEIAGPRADGVCEIELRAELEGGGVAVAELGRVAVHTPDDAPVDYEPAPSDEPLVAICMATYEPPADLLRRQLDSIRAQTHANWVCVISDDCSTPEGIATLEEAIAGDPRFVLSRSPERLGFYRNFERALMLAPRAADFVALADQDDVWHADKLSSLLGALGDAELVYSDARIVSRDGELISDTYWTTRRNNHTNLLSLLVANSVTGAAARLPRRRLAPPPPRPAACSSTPSRSRPRSSPITTTTGSG